MLAVSPNEAAKVQFVRLKQAGAALDAAQKTRREVSGVIGAQEGRHTQQEDDHASEVSQDAWLATITPWILAAQGRECPSI
jgi:hypothetical protein